MYSVRLECPQESTNRSRPIQCGSVGSCRITFWNNRYAAGARLIAVPGWPLPDFSTASIARTRTVSTARRSTSDQVSSGPLTSSTLTAVLLLSNGEVANFLEGYQVDPTHVRLAPRAVDHVSDIRN